jgi:arginine decarboxylase
VGYRGDYRGVFPIKVNQQRQVIEEIAAFGARYGHGLEAGSKETLGDLHNLMGDTNVVSVRINADGSFDFVKEMQGDSIADVLSYVEYDPRSMQVRFRDTAEQAVRSGRITPAERGQILAQFAASLNGYTYFEK